MTQARTVTVAARLMMIGGALLPIPALAYIGPGAGLGAVAITVALVLGLLLLVVGLVWYPLKRFLKRRRAPPPIDAREQDRNDP